MTDKFAFIERGDTTSVTNTGETVEITPPSFVENGRDQTPVKIRIEDAPQDTIATSPDMAAVMAAAMLELISSQGELHFRVEYPA